MDSKSWIQHRSGQGPKYEASLRRDMGTLIWVVSRPTTEYDLYLPYDEYVVVSPPERWIDVTGELTIKDSSEIVDAKGISTFNQKHRRVLKHIPFPHIIIERLEECKCQ